LEKIFVTGGTGFLGRHLLPELARAGAKEIRVLSRSGKPPAAGALPSCARIVHGDLLQSSGYTEALQGASCVIHMAAATGKATREEHFQASLEATRRLVHACYAAGVERMLYVSSIAARFPNQTRYWYAQAKRRTELYLSGSRLQFTIVRPTMIFGNDSPVLAGLARLAALPVIPVLGDGRTPVQPVAVEDAARVVAALAGQGDFCGETMELGGPEALPIEELLKKMARRLRAGEPRVIRLPFGLVIPPLTVLEMLINRALPVTVGQLAAFRNSGAAERHPSLATHTAKMKSLEEMLAALG